MKRGLVTALFVGMLAVSACTSTGNVARPGQAGYAGNLAGTSAKPVLRLGLMENVDDATAFVGLGMRFYQENLGGTVNLRPSFYTTSSAEQTALLAGKLDAAYLDPVTALAVSQADGGSLLRIVAGAASGGSELIAHRNVTSAADLDGTSIAGPDSATESAALRYWLHKNDLPLPSSNAAISGMEAVRQFASGKILAAWEPPPYDTEMIAAGGHVLVNEASSWPGGQFTSAVLVVTRKLLDDRGLVVTGLLKGQIQANQFITTDKAVAEGMTTNELAAALGTSIPDKQIARAFTQVTFTDDPLSATLLAEARQAAAVGLLKPVPSLRPFLDLNPLNHLLRAAGQAPVRT